MGSFKHFLKDSTSSTPRVHHTQEKTKTVYTGRSPDVYANDLHESMLKGVWKMIDDEYEEDQEQSGGAPKINQARQLFQQMAQQPNITRSDIIDAFIKQINVTDSTAVSYYERLAKEAGLTHPEGQGAGTPPSSGSEEQPEQDGIEVSGDPDRQGVIRKVDNAHLVYKRQNEDSTYDELWVYNIDDKVKSEIDVRRAILAGTDIEPTRTRSADGTQTYDLWTAGNAQMLHIQGLPN